MGSNPSRGAKLKDEILILNTKDKNDTYYCFPDIHGMNNLLQKALQFVYNKHPEGGKIIFIGDYIDRGPNNKAVLETVMNPPKNWEFICLMGNHEDMFINSYMNKTEFYDMKVVEEYHNGGLICYENLHDNFPVEIVEWMMQLKKFHFEDDNIFAHAFYDDTVLPTQQRDTMLLWYRMDDWESFHSKGDKLYLTHGHTPRRHGPAQALNRTNLDCGAVFYKRFVIGEYRKNVRGPVDFHEFT